MRINPNEIKGGLYLKAGSYADNTVNILKDMEVNFISSSQFTLKELPGFIFNRNLLRRVK